MNSIRGEKKMPTKQCLIAFLFLNLLFSGILFANSEKIQAYYFYGEGCPHCAKALPFVKEIDCKYQEVEVQYFEIYQNRSNVPLLLGLFETFNVPPEHQGVPIAFIDNAYISGDQPIMEHFEEKIIEEISRLGEGGGIAQNESDETSQMFSDNIIGIDENKNTTGLGYGGLSQTEPDGISFWVITGAAIVDSINPCAIAVLLILLGTLLMAKDHKRALHCGLAFIASLYIMYFLFGLGLMSFIQFTGLSYLFYQFVGILAIIIGFLNVKDYFWYGGGGFVMEIPRSWRPLLKKFLTSVTSPAGAFIMGFLVVLFELPCTGGPYVFILGLLAEKSTMINAIPLLLYYNFIFVLPLIILTFAMYYGMTRIEEMDEWKERNLRKLHLVAGLIMIALGLAVALRII